MCIDRIVSIFCASAWLMLGPLPGGDGVKVLETPASTSGAATAGESAGRCRDDEVLGEDVPGDQAEPAAAAE